MQKVLTTKVDSIGTNLNDFDNEYKLLDEEINNIKKVMLTVDDGKRIWKHFQRFCEYEDLKDLYSRTMPEINKFEGRLIQF